MEREITGYSISYRYMGEASTRSGYIANDLEEVTEYANWLSERPYVENVEIITHYREA